ncbi:uncharacterized protein LOC106087502 [Stomoxys calcitrans]|uniref:uncharacterized protein LOC106087502 n=1 Tax=Stomoxys calcitrans TaxID=35570 RepID=UPI0027E35E82|nr:uncharacterized protein LOC106087502 [Stomoxys calcitrans]
MSTVNERIDKLKEEASDLRKEVRELKDTLQQQNELIISLLKRQNELLLVEASSSTSTGRNVSELIRRFPIASLEELEKYDAEINEENMQHNIRIMQNLLAPHGLPKNIVNVLTDKVIMETNVDGHHNKKRLLNYGKFIDVMFHACNKDGYSKKEFLNALRKALKNSKNRCHKNNCVARQKLRECNTVAEVPMDIIKTEEIFFD